MARVVCDRRILKWLFSFCGFVGVRIGLEGEMDICGLWSILFKRFHVDFGCCVV